jgi:hypothetical protein
MPANALVQHLVHVMPNMLAPVVGMAWMLVAKVVHRAIQNVSAHCLYLHPLALHRRSKHDMGKGGVGEAILQT